MKDIVLIYPHQLCEHHPAFVSRVTKNVRVYLIEDPLLFSQYRFHKQKLVLHRASMKAYEQCLRSEGYDVCYVEYHEAYDGWITHMLAQETCERVHVMDVVDDWLHKKIVKEVGNAAELIIHDSPLFFLTDAEVKTYWGIDSKHLHHHFYIWQRKRMNVLVHEGKPVGGAWSFDKENRKRLPPHEVVPPVHRYERSSYVEEALGYVAQHFADHYGALDEFNYAVTHEEAKHALTMFLKERFAKFGVYEDAMSVQHPVLFHSVLSPYLNNGLLTPHEVLDAVLHYAEHHDTPLSSLEGFVRQLIGWREYIRMVYVCDGARMRNQNVLNAHRPLPESWWQGTTNLLPIDEAITTLDRSAYTHHIIRLMVVGNMMTLLGINPHDGYRWFMEWYIDAYDWVMVPNVYGMALFADGGTMTTKPYLSSSNYLKKMSDYPKGEWQKVWDALYWKFVDTHRDLLMKQQRASFAVRMFDRLSKEKREECERT